LDFYYQLFLVESMMDLLLAVTLEDPPFTSLSEANDFFKRGNYQQKE